MATNVSMITIYFNDGKSVQHKAVGLLQVTVEDLSDVLIVKLHSPSDITYWWYMKSEIKCYRTSILKTLMI